MKLTKSQLQKLIKEELENISEQPVAEVTRFAPEADPEFGTKLARGHREENIEKAKTNISIALEGFEEILKITTDERVKPLIETAQEEYLKGLRGIYGALEEVYMKLNKSTEDESVLKLIRNHSQNVSSGYDEDFT